MDFRPARFDVIPPVVKNLMIINGLFFLAMIILGKQGIDISEHLALYHWSSDKFRIWQLVTHMFMHGGVMHIAFNMFALVSFGTMLESIWGSKKFLFFYISCGLGAGILQNLINSYTHDILSVAVGASGAIYGLLTAFAFMFPNAELALMFIPVPIKAKYFVPLLLLSDLYFGVTGTSIFGGASGIAHFAHIGGALCGFIMMWYWKKNSFNDKRWN